MSPRNRLLGVLFLLSLGLASALEQPWRGDAIARTEAAVSSLFPRLAREAERVARVEILTAAGPAVTLAREASGFVVVEKLGHPADTLRVEQLLAALSALDTGDTVSTNPVKRGVYGVDDATGTRVRVLDENGGVLADLVAGKLRSQDPSQMASVRLDFYVRPADGDAVLLVEELSAPSTDPLSWLTRRLFPSTLGGLVELERRDLEGNEAESWKLRREPAPDDPATEQVEDHRWWMTAPAERPATLYAGDSWAYTISELGPADVVAVATEDELEHPRYGFSTNAYHALTADGKQLVLYLGRPASDDSRYAWVPGLPWIYTIPEHDAIQLRMPVERMLQD